MIIDIAGVRPGGRSIFVSAKVDKAIDAQSGDIGSVEYCGYQGAYVVRKTLDVRGFGSVQKSPSSKATAKFERGAYMPYVSTQNWRERRWRLFSTDPYWMGRMREEERTNSLRSDKVRRMKRASDPGTEQQASIEDFESIDDLLT